MHCTKTAQHFFTANRMASKQLDNNRINIDLGIFRNKHHDCINDQNHLKCPSLLRISVALKYYQLLNPMNENRPKNDVQQESGFTFWIQFMIIRKKIISMVTLQII